MLFNSDKTGGNICIILSHKGITKEEFEDTKGVIRIRKSTKDKQHKRKRTKVRTTIYKTLHIKHTKNIPTKPPIKPTL